MDNFTLKRVSENDKALINNIANIHENLPAAWIDNYHVSSEDINKTVEQLSAKRSANSLFCSIIEKNSNMMSYIWAEVNPKDAKQVDIISLWTDEAHRGQGYAKRLKVELERWALNEVKATSLHPVVSTKNSQMIKLNEGLGYHTRYVRMYKDL
ncbi:GNAT family N-acetyltransferase [Salipaludibacillus agaradhaerens]|uniref:GNAT family N-acetyltransferase n=1 Tax=Salipaludibacillus agaradhaerens TaxID=76935 RepID=UPI000997A35C|nr:GNAT family N-acetyltransferase [Salipaludibacillus agaradhaerens]